MVCSHTTRLLDWGDEMTEESADWLYPDREKQQAAQKEQGLLFSQKYLVFSGSTSDPRARELFEHWTRMVRTERIPRGASPQEYAAANSLREFVEQIHLQIEFASKGQNLPPVRTT